MLEGAHGPTQGVIDDGQSRRQDNVSHPSKWHMGEELLHDRNGLKDTSDVTPLPIGQENYVDS